MKQMKKFIYAGLLAALFALPSLAQDKPLKWGVEIEASPIFEDRSAIYAFLTSYAGLYAEWHFTPRFSTKLAAGLNYTFLDVSHVEDIVGKKIHTQKYWSLSLEPRYYLLPQAKAWGTFYAALPISLKTSPQTGYYRKDRALFVLPTLGYRYAINKHFAFELSAGTGLVSELRKLEGSNMISQHTFDYSLQARIGYNF
jgi:hypothetical protein